jgi:hypothetical protein
MGTAPGPLSTSLVPPQTGTSSEGGHELRSVEPTSSAMSPRKPGQDLVAEDLTFTAPGENADSLATRGRTASIHGSRENAFGAVLRQHRVAVREPRPRHRLVRARSRPGATPRSIRK